MFDFFKIVYGPTFIVQLLTISLSLVLVFFPIQREKRAMLNMGLHILCIFLGETLLNWGFFALSWYWRWLGGLNWQIVWFITIFIYLTFFCKTYLPGRIMMGVTLFVTVITMTNLGNELSYIFPALGTWDIGNYISYSLILVFSVLLRGFTLSGYSDVPPVSVIFILINGALSTWLVFSRIIANLGAFSADSNYVELLISLYVFAATSYLMVYFHCKANKEKLLLEIQNRLLKTDKEVLAVSESALEEMRSIRHDIKNQCQVMELMIDTGKYDDLKEYFRSMNEQFEMDTPALFSDSGNQILDSILNMEILKANSYGIRLFTKVNVGAHLDIDPSDLCRVIVNLLDNAMEGVLRAKPSEYLVDCKIGQNADYFYICVQNAVFENVDKEELLQMNTEKEDVTRHGYGHRIVKHIVEKYNGSIHYTLEEGMFIAKAMLVLQPKK